VALSAAKAAAAHAALAALQPADEAAAGKDGAPLDPVAVDRVWEMVKDRIASHMIANYQARVQARCQEPA
jgi:hypothetical protein